MPNSAVIIVNLFVAIFAFFSICCSNASASDGRTLRSSENEGSNGSLVSWSKIKVSHQKQNRTLLNMQYKAELKQGRLAAIIGPSGAGKSTLLNLLSGKLKKTSFVTTNGLQVSADIFPIIDGANVAYIHQDDSFFSMLTVKETLELAAALQLPNENEYDRKVAIKECLHSMSLINIENSRVGDALGKRGISGGERKRLAVACELLSKPSLLIADEPTSGLDAYQAYSVVAEIKRCVIARQMAGVATLHQPRSSIYNLIDDLIVLAPGGRVIYHGERDGVLDWFNKLGYPIPKNTNPAEHLIDLVSIDMFSKETIQNSEKRIKALVQAFDLRMLKEEGVHSKNSKTGGMIYSESSFHKKKVPVVQKCKRSVIRFSLIFKRAMRQMLRDSATNAVRMGVSALLAQVLGGLYGKQGDSISEESVGDRITIGSQATVQVAMLAMIKTLQLFKKERPVIARELAGKQYSSLEYLLAKSATELPMDALVSSTFAWVLHTQCNLNSDLGSFVRTLSMLGCASSSLGLAVSALSPSADIALAIGPAIMVVYVIMGTIGPVKLQKGKKDHLPAYLKFVRYASPIRSACEAICVAEFSNKTFAKSKIESTLKFIKFIPSMISDFAFRVYKNRLQPITKRQRKDGDYVLKDIGLANSSYNGGNFSLMKMVLIHTALAFIGLMFNNE